MRQGEVRDCYVRKPSVTHKSDSSRAHREKTNKQCVILLCSVINREPQICD